MFTKLSKLFLSSAFGIIFTLPLLASDITPELRAIENEEFYLPHIGLSLGVGTPEGSLNPGGNYALEVGFQPYIPFGVAAELSVADYSKDNLSLTRTSFLIKGTYNFGGDMPFIRYAYVGAGLGPMWENANDGFGASIGLLPNAGLDYPLKKLLDSPLSIGMNVSYLVTTSDYPDVFAVNGVVKYWY